MTTTASSRSPVEYLDEAWAVSATDAKQSGWTVPGWYHWDETWSGLFGPFKSREEANEHLKSFTTWLDDGGR